MTLLEASIKLISLWLAVDIITIATGWYLDSVIRPRYPGWWRRFIVDEAPG